MKKITLMLCACAMAFAGLLVSCSNGTEKWIDGTQEGTNYVYSITGTVTESVETGSTGSTTVTTDVYTLSSGRGSIWLNKENSKKKNNDNASTGGLWFGGKGDKSHTVGTAAAEKTYNVSFNSYGSTNIEFSKLDDNWYAGYSRTINGSYVSFDKVKLETVPEFDGSDYNFKISFVKDDSDSDAGTVDKKTLSFDISFKAVDAE